MINKLAIKFEEIFKVNFFLMGTKTIIKYPSSSMQILEEEYSSFRKKVGNKKVRNVKTTIQVNYYTKKALDDIDFMNRFTSYLAYDFKKDFSENENESVEVVRFSSVKDLTKIETGTTIYIKSLDITLNRTIFNDVQIDEIDKVSGTVNDEDLKIKKEVK